jgi:hypothetical protein
MHYCGGDCLAQIVFPEEDALSAKTKEVASVN